MKLEDVARLAGVSRTTASYVINGKAEAHRISATTVARVMEVVRMHGYLPDPAASALRRGGSRLLGLIIPDLANQSYAHLAQLLEVRARAEGFQLLVTCTEDDPDTEKTLVQTLMARRIDALLVASALADDQDFYPAICASGLPVVALDRALEPSAIVSVVSEERLGAQALTRSLLANDAGASSGEPPRTIGLLGARADLAISRQREEGFWRAIEGTGFRGECRYAATFGREEGAALCQAWLAEGTLPDLLVTTAYLLMEGVLDLLLQHPERLASMRLATFGDHRLLDFLPVKINALPQQFSLIAEQAIALTLQAISGDYRPGIHVIPRLLKSRS